MAIQADKKYHLVYTALAFGRNEQFLRKIQAQYGLEIPFIDYDLPVELKEALDTYIYVSEDGGFQTVFNKLRRQYSQVNFTHLGLVPGIEILKLMQSCEATVQRHIAIGSFYRIIQGDLRNLQVQLLSHDENEGKVGFQLLGEQKELDIPLAALELIDAPLNPWAGFRNLMTTEFDRDNKNAVIVDGSYALHRAMFGNDKLYTKKKRFVGGCSGFYFELLRLKELYPEYELHVVFDGYDKRKFEDNPEYKSQRVTYTDKWYKAYADNLDWCKRLTQALGFHLHVPTDKEGDDVVGSLATRLTQGFNYQHVVIFSLDTDFYQLVDERIHLLLPKLSFRGNSVIVTPERAREYFGFEKPDPEDKSQKILTCVNRNDKINWFRALAGDSSDNIKSINKFMFEYTNGTKTMYGAQHYLPIINAADTIEDCRDALRDDPRFNDFVEQGQFEANLKLLTIRRDYFDTYTSLAEFKGEFNYQQLEGMLAEVSFFKEIEMLPRVARIFQSIW